MIPLSSEPVASILLSSTSDQPSNPKKPESADFAESIHLGEKCRYILQMLERIYQTKVQVEITLIEYIQKSRHR